MDKGKKEENKMNKSKTFKSLEGFAVGDALAWLRHLDKCFSLQRITIQAKSKDECELQVEYEE